MKKAIVWILVVFMSLAICGDRIVSASNMAESDSILTFSEEGFNLIVKPGEKTYIKLPVRTKEDYILDPVVSIEANTADSPFTFSKPTMITEFDMPVVMMTNTITAYIEFEVNTKETAGIKSYPTTLVVKGVSSFTGENVNATLPFELKILEEKAPSQLTVGRLENDNLIPGKKSTLSFVVKNEGEVKARNTFVSINYGESGIKREYSAVDIKVGDLAAGEEKAISLPISVLPTATAGRKELVASFNMKNIDGDELKSNYDFSVNIKANENAPSIDISEVSGNEGLKPGQEFELVVKLDNFGESKAEDVRVSIDNESQTNFIKDYFTDYILAYDIKADASKEVKIPLIVSRNAGNGFSELKLELQYKDSMGILYSSTRTVYIEVTAEEEKGATVIISNVKQVPEAPTAGGKLEVSFDMLNKSAIDLNELKIKLKNLTGNSFNPVESDPYKYIGVLKAGETKRITIPLTVSESILEGLNTLSIEYSYTGGGDSVDIPVLNIQNELGSVSKPRLIVSEYNADVDDLRAGSAFNFEFEISNTHSSVAAKNIIISVSGKDPREMSETFSVTQGSNSFFINKIGPGESITRTLEMKVKNDAATSTYPMLITIEYEYDGIEPNPTTGDIGETEAHELTLQVTENARPMVDRVDVYSYDGMLTVGNPATLFFEFYNMGKSTLNNVVATLEGDGFSSSGGTMHFLGNVMAGSQAYAEMEVIPNMEGVAYGVLKITFEDSNGDEQTYTKEFESTIMSEPIWDPDMNGDMDAFNPIIPEPKKAILPIWAFVLMQVVIFIIFIPVTRKIIISIYKSRRLKKEDEML